MGYKIFGVKVDKDSARDIGFTAKGAVNAYVQWTQEVPQGMHRLASWPVEVFDEDRDAGRRRRAAAAAGGNAVLHDVCEVSPLEWQGRLCELVCHRPASGGTQRGLLPDRSGTRRRAGELTRFGQGYSLASAVVLDGTRLRVGVAIRGGRLE